MIFGRGLRQGTEAAEGLGVGTGLHPSCVSKRILQGKCSSYTGLRENQMQKKMGNRYGHWIYTRVQRVNYRVPALHPVHDLGDDVTT